MNTVDFARSFLTFRVDHLNEKPSRAGSHKARYMLNNARIQIECRCRITDSESGTVETIVLGANCKTERVGVERDIWTEPNADFVPIFSGDCYLLLKTFARYGTTVELYPPGSGTQNDRQQGLIADTFDDVRIDVIECAGTLLETRQAVIEATLANRPLVARTEIEHDRFTTLLEYPVRTMNVNERDGVYQTDTGPVLFPNFSGSADDWLGGLELAFTAFNCPDWTEFLVRAPTSIGDDVRVQHYSRSVRLDTKNSVIDVGLTSG